MIDHAEILSAVESAVQALTPLLQSEPATLATNYEKYFNPSPMIRVSQQGAPLTKRLVEQMCARLGYKVYFLKAQNNVCFGVMGDFVSWLFANFERKELAIVFNPHKIRKTLNDASLREHDRVLAKVFLHECGHAHLHLDVIRARMSSESLNPSLDPPHEIHAWIFSLMVWSILVGEHSYRSRVLGYGLPPTKVDLGWTVV